MNYDYRYIGRRVCMLYPKIAQDIIEQAKEKKLLYDYRDISILNDAFYELFGLTPTNDLKNLSIKESTDYRMKFTALVVHCYDPESLKDHHYKKMRNSLRQKIAEHLSISPATISQYIPKIRLYLQVYNDFSNDVQILISCAKIKIENR